MRTVAVCQNGGGGNRQSILPRARARGDSLESAGRQLCSWCRRGPPLRRDVGVAPSNRKSHFRASRFLSLLLLQHCFSTNPTVRTRRNACGWDSSWGSAPDCFDGLYSHDRSSCDGCEDPGWPCALFSAWMIGVMDRPTVRLQPVCRRLVLGRFESILMKPGLGDGLSCGASFIRSERGPPCSTPPRVPPTERRGFFN